MMRLLCCALLAWCALAGRAAATEPEFPITRRVVSAAASVHCGPGDTYYATDQLPTDAEVEVFRRDAGGWLAIRPPASSFSLVAARQVQITDQADVAEVIDGQAVSWMGRHDADAHDHKWQVRLREGERVTVLGEEQRRVYRGGPLERFYRIAPPAGEFRWIHQRHLQGLSPPPQEAIDAQVRLAEFRVVAGESSGPQRRDGFVARRETRGPTPREAFERVDEAAARLPKLDAVEFATRARQLDVNLSLAVAKPAGEWDLSALREEVDQLVARGASTVERARAQLLSQKLAEFEQLQARYASTTGSLPQTTPGSSENRPTTATAAAGAGFDPRFDGTGWLLPVHSSRQAAPPYALLDEDGKVIQFVSPAPGLNLHRYLRKEIGIYGQRRHVRDLDKPLLTAHRVVDLKRHRR